MSENHSDSLIQQFLKMSQPDTYKLSLKFKTENKTIFEIELSSNGMIRQEMKEQLMNVIDHSVTAAAKTIISAK
ncbi:hypothetical protein QDR86_04020 [Acinetobacter baumannii]|uniref:hypothetical protein n=1 Tax=Acinetobacter baumannii TaxID=470 RepID=UPI002448ED2C|nr:hypothetical protein [Acinetobacter baumannii]MDH2630446.1 hypothetical protein [Acinetobacter baumannii]HAV5431157.1 hypothetical protein [Acinetobacter baumannii]